MALSVHPALHSNIRSPLELSINSIPFNRHLSLVGHHAERQPPRESLGASSSSSLSLDSGHRGPLGLACRMAPNGPTNFDEELISYPASASVFDRDPLRV